MQPYTSCLSGGISVGLTSEEKQCRVKGDLYRNELPLSSLIREIEPATELHDLRCLQVIVRSLLP